MPLPSEVGFTSFLQYSPRGVTPTSKLSKTFTLAVKNDRIWEGPKGRDRAIAYAAARLAEDLPLYDCLRTCFGGDVILVPAPRRAPLVPGGLWPTQRLCDAVLNRGLATRVLPLIERRATVTKSATAARGERPDALMHYESMAVNDAHRIDASGKRLVIVDDVITRGATLLACYARLHEAYPDSPIDCFALIRTMSGLEVATIRAPVSGTVHHSEGNLHRVP